MNLISIYIIRIESDCTQGGERMKFLEQKCLSNAFALEMIKAAEKKANELGIAVNIAVVDPGGT